MILCYRYKKEKKSYNKVKASLIRRETAGTFSVISNLILVSSQTQFRVQNFLTFDPAKNFFLISNSY